MQYNQIKCLNRVWQTTVQPMAAPLSHKASVSEAQVDVIGLRKL